MTSARRWTQSYRARLVLGYALVVAVFGVAWAWSLFGPLTSALIEQQTRALTSVVNAGVVMAETSDATWQQIADTLGQQTGQRLTVVDATGTVLADSSVDAAEMENHATRPEIAAALANRIGVDQRVSKTEGAEQLYVAVPAQVNGARVAIRASERVASIEQLVARSRRLGLFLLVVAIALAVLIAAGMSKGLAEPVQRLAAAAERMAAGDLGAEIPRPSGELGVLADSLSDLSRQMRARIDDLETEQRSMRSVLDGLDDAVFLLDGEVIRFANRSATELFKTPVGGWRNHDIRDALLPASLMARIVELLDTPQQFAEDLGPDPTGRTLRLSVVPLTPAEAGPRTLVVVSDITQRARLDRIRRDFVANASHELKTPVAGIQLLAESAAHAAQDGDDEQALVFTRQISEQSSRLQRLVMDLLDLSRLESEGMPTAVTDVREGVRNALAGHNAAAEARGLYLRFDESKAYGEDVYVAADPTDFAVALDNLIDNALAYTETGGVLVDLAPEGDLVRLGVEDTGIGILEEELPRIFERFYRVDKARSREKGGTGLGLALVRHVVERSGGTVSVESTPLKGSRFTLILKRAQFGTLSGGATSNGSPTRLT